VLFGKTLGEHIGNLGNILGTWWEREGNTLGTKKKKKGKSWTPQDWLIMSAYWALLIDCMKQTFLFPKTVGHNFWPGLKMAGPQQTVGQSYYGWIKLLIMLWVRGWVGVWVGVWMDGWWQNLAGKSHNVAKFDCLMSPSPSASQIWWPLQWRASTYCIS
jgi:hypothetical protein